TSPPPYFIAGGHVMPPELELELDELELDELDELDELVAVPPALDPHPPIASNAARSAASPRAAPLTGSAALEAVATPSDRVCSAGRPSDWAFGPGRPPVAGSGRKGIRRGEREESMACLMSYGS